MQKHSRESMHSDTDLRPADPEINRPHPQLMGSLYAKFHDDKCKWKTVMQFKPFSVIN